MSSPARDLAPDQSVWVSVTEGGLISRATEGKTTPGSVAAPPAWLLQTHTRDTLYLVTENGDAAAVGVHTLPGTDNLMRAGNSIGIRLKNDDLFAVVFNLPQRKNTRQAGLPSRSPAGGW